MSLSTTINQDYIKALKSKNETEVSTLRMLKSAIKNKEISLGKDLGDQETIEVIAKEAKQRKDSIFEYEKANRKELAQKEKKELVILEKYLPEQLSIEKIKEIIETSIKEIGAIGISDMGKVMAVVISKVKGTADNETVSKIVKDKLAK